MKTNWLLRWWLMLLLALAAPAGRAAAPPLNFIFILVDDLGWTDLSCYGSKFYETPNIDRLAAQGMRFTQAYSACTVCSPTRAAILTGKYPARLHITDWIAGHQRPFAKLKVPDWTMHLPHAEITLAEALKPLGYATASIGKWHLGGPEYYPEKHGFDLNLAGCDRGQPPSYFSPYKIATLPDGPEGEFLTDRESLEACKFIEQNRARPFFLYLPHHAVHTPLMAKKEVREKYLAKARPGLLQTNATYAGLVESVDDSVGRIMGKLAELQLDDRTVIFLTSDNGGLVLSRITDNSPLRAGKGSAYEGGVRVASVIKWPGVTRPGSVSHTPVISVDFYPTLLEMADARPQPGQVLDGESLVPLLRGTGALRRTALYWHYPHYHPGGATPYSAIREGDHRLVEFFENNRVELYDLKADIGEKNDLAPSQPELAARLRAKLVAWRKDVGAQLPEANPNYDPEKDQPKAGAKKKPGQ
jgi:arylsulfatase A-like enzyme